MTRLLFVLLIAAVLIVIPGMASGQCNPDTHNDASTAKAVGLTGTIDDWVCPGDEWDCFSLEILQGMDVSGQIIFNADQTGTTIQISGPTGVLSMKKETTDSVRTFTIPVQIGSSDTGKYYLNVAFSGTYPGNHHYTITMNLTDKNASAGGSTGGTTGGGATGCVADNNETNPTAVELAFGASISDYVCTADTKDVYHFKVTNQEEAYGTINLATSPNVLAILLHNADEVQLFIGETTDGSFKHDLSSSGSVLSNGDYYISVVFPGGGTDENSYTLEITKHAAVVAIEPMVATVIKPPGPEIETAILGDLSKIPIFARIAIDSLYCVSESDWDAGSNSDEPYVIITGIAKHTKEKAWSTGKPEVFGDVDGGEIRRIMNQHIVYEDNVPSDSFIGFNVDLLEHDSGEIDELESAKMIVWSGTTAEGWITNLSTLNIPTAISLISMAVEGIFSGGGDDHVANSVVLVTYNDLKNWAGPNPKLFETDLDGGDSGHYKLRWHIEFAKNASRSFKARFTKFDGFGVGSFFSTSSNEVVIAVDEAGPGDFGKFTIYTASGNVTRKFDAFFTTHDQLAVGDVNGDGLDEIVVSSDDNSGFITVHFPNSLLSDMFAAPVTWYDGLAVADVTGDSKAEILLATDDSNSVLIYSGTGSFKRKLQLSKWQFDGVRYHDETSRHDAFLVGDVLGDNNSEIILIENNNGPSSVIHIYASTATTDVEVRPSVRFDSLGGTFTNHDGACLGDVTGDGKLELIIATDHGDGADGCKIKIYDLTKNVLVGERYWPAFTLYDGLAAGDLLGTGKAQIVSAVDEDEMVYITQ